MPLLLQAAETWNQNTETRAIQMKAKLYLFIGPFTPRAYKGETCRQYIMRHSNPTLLTTKCKKHYHVPRTCMTYSHKQSYPSLMKSICKIPLNNLKSLKIIKHPCKNTK
jgi:hypothetical protein